MQKAPGLTLLHNKTFRQGSGSVVKALPAVVHFSGFEVGKVHTLTLVLTCMFSYRYLLIAIEIAAATECRY